MRLAVAVSGGADSIALMLHALTYTAAAEIIALSIDHRTRSAAASERSHATAVAERLGISFHTIRTNPKGKGHAQLRTARFTALIDYCANAGITRLWLGQHADDAVETAAIRLLAGGRLSALAGIASHRQVRGVTVERPLLHHSSRELRRKVMASGNGWIEDPSNRALAYKRSVVRRCLAASPTTRPKSLARIRQAAQWRIADERLLAKAWSLVATCDSLGSVTIDAAHALRLPLGLRARVLAHAAALVVGDANRLRNADFTTAAASGPPCPLGGALFGQQDGQWNICRDPSSIGPPVPLERQMVWDRRFALSLSGPPPSGSWTVVAVGSFRIGAMSGAGSAGALAALPAIARDGVIVSIPALGIWRGETGPFWAANLSCELVQSPEPPIFQLVR